jgi:hypothetical protein
VNRVHTDKALTDTARALLDSGAGPETLTEIVVISLTHSRAPILQGPDRGVKFGI